MALIRQAAAANPAPFGLWDAATGVDIGDGAHFFDGVTVRNVNCGPGGSWPLDCDPPVQPDKGGDRAQDLTFTGVATWAADDCSLLVPQEEAEARAAQLLRLLERAEVEAHVATELQAKAGAPVSVTGLVAAVGRLEELASAFGYLGVLHAAPHHAADLLAAHLIKISGNQLLSPLGHRWAFGAGYVGLGETLYATGQVTWERTPPNIVNGQAVRANERLTIAEREHLVWWDCYTLAVTVA